MFQKVQTKSEAQKLFHQLAFRLHPDHGGSNELMSLLIEDYEFSIRFMEKFGTPTQSDPIITQEQGKRYEIVPEKIPLYDVRMAYFWELDKYYEKNPHKKTEFFCGVMEYAKEHNYITRKQYNALIRTYNALKLGDEIILCTEDLSASCAQ